MDRGIRGVWEGTGERGDPALAVIAASFLLGSFFGYFMACHTADEGGFLSRYLEQLLAAAEAGGLIQPELTGVLWRSFRWSLMSFLLGFTALGLFGLPLLTLLRGFFLSFSVATFAAVYGRMGLETAFLLLGLSALITVPAFLILSVQSFCTSRLLACHSEGQRIFSRVCALRTVGCVCALIFAGILETRLVPLLLTGLAGRIRG